jgi:hypothetical protein
MIRSAALLSCILALPVSAHAQGAADVYKSALYIQQMDRGCQLLSLEARLYTDHIIYEVSAASDAKSADMLSRLRRQTEAMADKVLEAGCTTAAANPQTQQIRSYFESTAVALSFVLDGMPAECRKRAQTYLERSRADRTARLYPASTTQAQRDALQGQIQTMVDQWSGQCAYKPGLLNDDGPFNFEQSDWQKTPIHRLIRPYSEMGDAPAGATNYLSLFDAEGYRSVGPAGVAVMMEPHYIWNNGAEPVIVEGLGDGSLQVRLPNPSNRVAAVNLHRIHTTDGPGEKTLEFQKTGPGLYHLSPAVLQSLMDEGGYYVVELKGSDGRDIFSASSDRRDARRDPNISLHNFVKVRRWALAPTP